MHFDFFVRLKRKGSSLLGLTKEEMISMLRRNVVPAFGCTEPVAVALAAADAAKAVGGVIQNINLKVSGNIYKNGMAVGIPNFDAVGIPYAAALGAFLQNPEKRLELLQAITPDVSEKAKALVAAGGVSVDIDKSRQGVYVECRVETSEGLGESIIAVSHANIILTRANGKILHQQEAGQKTTDPLLEKLREMKIAEIRALVDSATEEELSFMEDGVRMNESAVLYSMTTPGVGVGISKAMHPENSRVLGNDLLGRVMRKVSSATEGRLDGCPYAVMSSAGSGSKGVAVILPVAEAAEEFGASREMKVKALAFAHLLNEYINSYVGKLSAICACAMAASPAASAAITWLMGGGDKEIAGAIRNMAGDITGIICDGGKVGCGLKLATAAAGGLMSAMLAMQGAVIRKSDGIVAESAEDCIRNMGRVSIPGMVETDHVILDIMLDKAAEKA